MVTGKTVATDGGMGDHVPKEDDVHWICFIDLLRILCLTTAVEITDDCIDVLTLLIENYLYQFNALYPNSITPKSSIFLTRLNCMPDP